MSEILDLVDYRRRVAEIYREVRAADDATEAWQRWRTDRDDLFSSHSQSPIEDQDGFNGLPYFDYDPAWRLFATFQAGDDHGGAVPMSGGGSAGFTRVGQVLFEVQESETTLDVLWLEAYGGGLFIPFRDGTNGDFTYGGGRYLLDTVKGADLGHSGDQLVLDFNFSYHPSCVHSPRWSCPLAPPANRLEFQVAAGEKLE